MRARAYRSPLGLDFDGSSGDAVPEEDRDGVALDVEDAENPEPNEAENPKSNTEENLEPNPKEEEEEGDHHPPSSSSSARASDDIADMEIVHVTSEMNDRMQEGKYSEGTMDETNGERTSHRTRNS
jgi:hypothetical protein